MRHAARTSFVLSGLLFVALGCAACSSTKQGASAVPPLPTDSNNANPAGPNCYPDINHCASYPSGNVTNANPAQSSPQK
jgi:hypothetical protein